MLKFSIHYFAHYFSITPSTQHKLMSVPHLHRYSGSCRNTTASLVRENTHHYTNRHKKRDEYYNIPFILKSLPILTSSTISLYKKRLRLQQLRAKLDNNQRHRQHQHTHAAQHVVAMASKALGALPTNHPGLNAVARHPKEDQQHTNIKC